MRVLTVVTLTPAPRESGTGGCVIRVHYAGHGQAGRGHTSRAGVVRASHALLFFWVFGILGQSSSLVTIFVTTLFAV